MPRIDPTYIEPAVGKAEFRQALDVSSSTFDRWLAEARRAVAEGKKPILPLPIFDRVGKRRRLIWSRGAISDFLSNRSNGIPQPPTVDSMSEAERQREHNTAMRELVDLGVNVGIPKRVN